MSDIPLDQRAFEKALSELVRTYRATTEGAASYHSDDSVRCHHCMFTTGSTDCSFCTYCRDCTNCTYCTQCTECEHCHQSSYCVRSKRCANSSYLILSEDCTDCVFCFGCVGLVKKEFHILNQKFSRDRYFKLVKELKAAMKIA
ncbi:caib/baif family protein [Bradymonadaceae bacterium TMQ3]|uniref:Caib/baif family protein n=1 Tax=Lujinxingia sediminis TaxID=2480984 RepID=A0ABY0CMM3_9DELT|nr:caib/baif family protein [Lujinxingia sediminis]RDV38350.1 caib/baif family protein [Bradymonadaceae bacterium TMQ3]RVU40670.1 caib/baif family protein [Lujinxingia sediminis]TXC76023.1 caib/baif family protein [Bradymonadales bacterium TMQ1]